MASHTPSRTGSWTHGRLAQAGVGIGVAASVLATAAVATAAPQAQATHTPAQASVAHIARHTVANPDSSVTVSPRIARGGERITIPGDPGPGAGQRRVLRHGDGPFGPEADQLRGDGHLPGQGPGHRRLDDRPLNGAR
jgi:hypothetical protein